MDKIIEAHDLDDLLFQLAEEATELAQVVAKYYREAHGVKPSLASMQNARDALVEEIAEINVAAEAVRRKLGIACDEIAEAEDAKIESWRGRVENGI